MRSQLHPIRAAYRIGASGTVSNAHPRSIAFAIEPLRMNERVIVSVLPLSHDGLRKMIM